LLPKVANAQTKTVENSARNAAPDRSALATRPVRGNAIDRAYMPERTIGSQATPRLFWRSARNLARNESQACNEREASLASLTARGATRGVSWDFGRIPLFPQDQLNQHRPPSPVRAPSLPGSIQTKLEVGRGDDPLERQADKVAEQVMRISDSEHSTADAPQQPNRQCCSCGEEVAQTLKMQGEVSSNVGARHEAPSIAAEVLRSPGQPLDQRSAAFFQTRFHQNLSHVRVHTDAKAAESARSINAIAYNAGSHIVFGTGYFAPTTKSGKLLLAHELVHSLQSTQVVRRFESEEYKTLGNEASGSANTDINIGTDDAPRYLTFGEAVALLGDYFASPQDLWSETDPGFVPTNCPLTLTPQEFGAEMTRSDKQERGRARLRWAYWFAFQSNPLQSQGKVGEPPLSEGEKKKIKDRYFMLAAGNISHFGAGGTAGPTHDQAHVEALRIAYQTGVTPYIHRQR